MLFGEYQVEEDDVAAAADKQLHMDYDNWGLKNFLESWDLSDMLFIVGPEERPVPAHKSILAASGNFPFCSSFAITLPTVSYPLLHALLHYIYTGWTQVPLLPSYCSTQIYIIEAIVVSRLFFSTLIILHSHSIYDKFVLSLCLAGYHLSWLIFILFNVLLCLSIL
jgi:hypothetical protein